MTQNSRALSHVTLPNRSLKRPKSALLKYRVGSLLCALLSALRILNSTISWSLQPSLFLNSLNFTFLTGPCWLLYHLEKEFNINTFQEPPGLLMPCCVVPPTYIRMVEVPHDDQDL
ncbi:unnamed protein product [Bubo scandiacus]